MIQIASFEDLGAAVRLSVEATGDYVTGYTPGEFEIEVWDTFGMALP
ncbi:MAG: hypothetical protein GTO30_09100, partial [Acidobacteria bacterium]|nr:hypothetical protein [Acidobacteriota bacterium]NIQ86934.1 hypothetical protein [Acidobacteriota bacterium]